MKHYQQLITLTLNIGGLDYITQKLMSGGSSSNKGILNHTYTNACDSYSSDLVYKTILAMLSLTFVYHVFIAKKIQLKKIIFISRLWC